MNSRCKKDAAPYLADRGSLLDIRAREDRGEFVRSRAREEHWSTHHVAHVARREHLARRRASPRRSDHVPHVDAVRRVGPRHPTPAVGTPTAGHPPGEAGRRLLRERQATVRLAQPTADGLAGVLALVRDVRHDRVQAARGARRARLLDPLLRPTATRSPPTRVRGGPDRRGWACRAGGSACWRRWPDSSAVDIGCSVRGCARQ